MVIPILIFILVLGLLIFIHELGHFLAAKWVGVRVEEFALGFPPTLTSFRRGETTYSLNALPIGGYVKLFGEDGEEREYSEDEKKRSFTHQNALSKIYILAAGVVMNILLAWVLAIMAFTIGHPTAGDVAEEHTIREATLIAHVLPESPASEAGLLARDVIKSISDDVRIVESPTAQEISNFVETTENDSVGLIIERRNKEKQIEVPLSEGILESGKAMGITTANVSFVRYPPPRAVWEGLKWTGTVTLATAQGIGTLLVQTFQGEASFDAVAGPVGIVSLVGDAYAVGFVYLLTFTALISVNLALINIFPFPALDGGRILFVIIEAIKGSPIPNRVMLITNGFGFALLMLLILLITVKDVSKLIG